MATRIDIELTSRRDDATFTWRAAGAREPKGVADASLFPTDATVGSEYKVEAEVELDGITITSVVPEKKAKPDPFETLELLSRDDEPLVTQQLAPKSRRGDRGKGRGKGRGDRGEGRGRGDGGRPQRDRPPAKPKLPPKPKAPRLKAGRAHRNALLDELPEAEKVVARELLQGGMQAVRTALAKQNEQRKVEGQEPNPEGPILALAESLLARVRAAEWRDRAEAALEQAKEVDVRDLRSVVTAADGAAKDDETRALAASLRTALNERLDAEHHAWVDEIVALLDDERVVRALHRSSRPPKAGALLPASVAMRLVEATNAALNSETTTERWGYTLEALAHSPIRRQVVPSSLPATVSDDLKTTIARYGTRLPEIAEIFGIEPDPKAGQDRRRRRKPKKAAGQDRAAASDAAADEAKDAPSGSDSSSDTAAPQAAPAEASEPAETSADTAATEADTSEPTGPEAETTESEPAESEPTQVGAEDAESNTTEAPAAESSDAESSDAGEADAVASASGQSETDES